MFGRIPNIREAVSFGMTHEISNPLSLASVSVMDVTSIFASPSHGALP